MNYIKNKKIDITFSSADISENTIRNQIPDILDILLIDRTTSTTDIQNNIIWANENYIQHGEVAYAATAQIKPELVTGLMSQIIMPRALKSRELQKQRTKLKAEVFTPTWIVKKQNDMVELSYLDDDLTTYVKRKWLEITCGEAPYMVTRYDMATGEVVPLAARVGFVDRKLKRINTEISHKARWQQMVVEAYKSSYGFEWNGDSLLLARENLLYTYRDYYVDKWQQEPVYDLFKDIAEIISYNLFQMDGLKYTIPLSNEYKKTVEEQGSLSSNTQSIGQSNTTTNTNTNNKNTSGRRVKIMNWTTKEMEFFASELDS